jgi:hypothetical protein
VGDSTAQGLTTSVINFAQGRSARLLIAGDGDASLIASSLNLPQPHAVILIIGGADDLDDKLKPELEELFSRGIARAAIDVNAVIIDGGTNSGVMSLMGQAVADRGRRTPLIGVAPQGKVTYPGGPAEGSIEGAAALDPNHSHFVLAQRADWGGEADIMFGLANGLSENIAVLTVLVNGGPIAKDEVLRSVRSQWPIVVIEGSGRIADEIAGYSRAGKEPEGDAVMAEIISEGNIQLFAAKGAPGELRRLIVRQLFGNSALRLAWERFAQYDSNAQRQQKSFSGLLRWILWLGVLATLLAVIHNQLSALLPKDGQAEPPLRYLVGFLKYVIILVPITISVLVAAANHFKTGKKWVLLRGGAEAIKREIFHYRTRTGTYGDEQIGKTKNSREFFLSQSVGNIARRVSQTEVNELALTRYDGSIPPPYGAAEADDGMSVLNPEAYIAVRLDDQLHYFESKSIQLAKQIRLRQTGIYILGGLGTLLAAINLPIWIAATTAIATALTAYLQHFQLENTLVKYNQSASDLTTVKAWWRALSKSEREIPKNKDLLVESTEKVLENELTGWVQRMQDAMAKIRAAEASGEAEKTKRTKGSEDSPTE